MDLAGFGDDVAVFADYRSPGSRLAVAKNHDGASAGLSGDGGDVV